MVEAPTTPGTDARRPAAPPASGLGAPSTGIPATPGSLAPAVRFERVSRTFGRGRAATPAIRDLSLTVVPGEVLAVVGPSGCGKTTLLELICGLQRPDSGRIDAAPAVLMPQQDLLLPWASALDNAALPLRIAGLDRASARRRALPLLHRAGLAGFERVRPAALSGGMRQRVAFLRTLLADKPVLALDEPFGALDALTRAEMQDWLADLLGDAPRTVVLVTHDVEEAVLLADRVLVLTPRPGRLVAELDVSLPRPRHRTDPELVAIRAAVLRALGAPG